MTSQQQSRILALTKIYPKGQTTVPVQVRQMLRLKEKEYIAWVLEHGDIVVRKGRWWLPAKMNAIRWGGREMPEIKLDE